MQLLSYDQHWKMCTVDAHHFSPFSLSTLTVKRHWQQYTRWRFSLNWCLRHQPDHICRQQELMQLEKFMQQGVCPDLSKVEQPTIT